MSEDEIVTMCTRAQLRKWLKDYHNVKTGNVWLATYKKHHPDYLPWIEAVEELICWGWIDAQVAKLDDDRMKHRIAPRKDSSAWSAVNKDIVARMRASGQMTDAGEAKIAAARANGMWTFLDDVERLEVPVDLAQAIGDARPVWDEYPRSVKRGTLEWIKTAKAASTRARRVDDVAQSARAGLRPSIFRR